MARFERAVLLKKFREMAARGEPIVGAPEDAYRCFMRTDMDALVLENFILEKTEQAPLAEDTSWRKEFVLD